MRMFADQAAGLSTQAPAQVMGRPHGDMAKLVDASDLKSLGVIHPGSTPGVPTTLNQPLGLEAGGAVPADDDVVVDLDLQDGRSPDDFLGHGNVRA